MTGDASASGAGGPGSPAPVSGAVLAGGKSKRLGQDKALAQVHEGVPLIATVVGSLRPLVDEVIVVADDDGERLGSLAARVVPDVYRGAGALGGIYAGLLATSHQHVLAVGCDMPFLSPNLLAYLLSLPRDYDVLLPRHADGKVEPLHAVYSQACRDAMRRHLLGGRFSAISYLDEVRVRYVEERDLRRFDPELRSFFNVNTPDQLREAIAIAKGMECRRR